MTENSKAISPGSERTAPWSYVNNPASRPRASGVGGFHRPPALRDLAAAKAFGKILRRERERLELSGYQLGAAVGVSQSYISQLETTTVKRIDIPTLFDFAEALAVDPMRLIAEIIAEVKKEARALEVKDKLINDTTYEK